MTLENSLIVFGPHCHYLQDANNNASQCSIMYANHHNKLVSTISRVSLSVIVDMLLTLDTDESEFKWSLLPFISG